MRNLHRLVVVAAWSVVLAMPVTVLAIDSSDGKSAFPGGPWYVGRVQQGTTDPALHNGTGSYLGNNIVLTCAHVINKLVQPGGGSLQMKYQYFQLPAYGPQQYSGLGVMDPNYNVAGVGGSDLGLIITLNMPQAAPAAQNFPVLMANPVRGAPGATYPFLPAIPNPPTANPANYPVLLATGYSSNDPDASAERTGQFTFNSVPAIGNFGSNLAPPVTPPPQAPPVPASPNAAYVQPGDSGGPWWTPGIVGPEDEIYGVTSYGNQADTLSIAVAVTVDLPFINGNGSVMGGVATTVRRIDPYVLPPGIAVAAGHAQVVDNFDAGGNFRGGLTVNVAIPKPGDGEIAVLNPLSEYDPKTEIDVTDQTASLDGLVNNVNLDVIGPGVGLNVTYGAANATGGSGVLNGGIMTVEDGATFTSSWKFDNEDTGILKLQDSGTAKIGYSNPNTVGDTVVHNGPGCEIEVDSNSIFKESHRMDNQGGTINVSQGTMICGELLPEKVTYLVDQYSTGGNGQVPMATQPIVVDNGLNSLVSSFTVKNGSTLLCHNAASSTVFLNEFFGTFNVSGDQAINPTVATTDSLDNYGDTDVSDNATLTNTRYTYNEFGGTITVAGGVDGLAALISGPLVNDGDFTISSGGLVTANSSGLAAVNGVTLPTQPFLNGFLGEFTVDTGGGFAVGLISSATNKGTMTFNNSFGYVGLMTNSGDLTVKGSGLVVGAFLNNQAAGTVKLTTVAGVNPHAFFGFVINNGTWNIDPAQTITQGDFNTGYGGVVTGTGQIVVGGNWVNQSRNNVDFNMKQMDLEFVDPATLNNPDPSETTAASINNPTPTYTGLNLSHLITPGVDVTNPGANPNAPVLYVGALELIPGLGDNPSASRTLDVDGQSVTTPDETTLDVHGGTIYDMTPLVLPADTEIIDSLDPGRSLSSMVQFVGSLPDDDYAVQSLILNGANYVVMEVPEPSAAMVAGIMVSFGLRRRGRVSRG